MPEVADQASHLRKLLYTVGLSELSAGVSILNHFMIDMGHIT